MLQVDASTTWKSVNGLNVCQWIKRLWSKMRCIGFVKWFGVLLLLDSLVYKGMSVKYFKSKDLVWKSEAFYFLYILIFPVEFDICIKLKDTSLQFEQNSKRAWSPHISYTVHVFARKKEQCMIVSIGTSVKCWLRSVDFCWCWVAVSLMLTLHLPSSKMIDWLLFIATFITTAMVVSFIGVGNRSALREPHAFCGKIDNSRQLRL